MGWNNPPLPWSEFERTLSGRAKPTPVPAPETTDEDPFAALSAITGDTPPPAPTPSSTPVDPGSPTPTPSTSTGPSPSPTPTATPATTSTLRSNRCPNDWPSTMTAAIAAKNGVG